MHQYRFGSVEFDEGRFELRVAGLAVDIQRKPLQVLQYLLLHEDSVVSKEELLENLWAGTLPVDNVVGNAIAKLRAALGEDNGKRIVTQPRVGYRLVGPIERRRIIQPIERPLQLQAGDAVPRRENFRLQSLVARSVANEVWLGRHVHTGECRIYKFAAGGDDLPRLKREVTLFRILAESLEDHSAFAAIIDWNLEFAPYFLECEFGGENLQQWAEAGHLSVAGEAQRLAIFVQLADAVAAAHSVGVLHKDLKPANVLITAQTTGSKIRLTDFGSGGVVDQRLAGLSAGGISLSALTMENAQELGGTQPYIAPELLRGQASTAQCDVYALGVLLYQLVSGDLHRALSTGWERDITDELLREDIAAATDGDPTRRIATVLELADRVRRLGERRDCQRELAATREQAARNAALVHSSRARRPWLIATFVILCVGLGAALLLYTRASEAKRAQSRQFAVAQALNNFLTSNFIAVANPTITGRKDVTVVEAARHAALDIDTVFHDTDPSIRGGLHAAMQSAFSGLSDVNSSLAEGQKALDALNMATPIDPMQLALVHMGMAALLAQTSQLDAAVAQLQAADALIQKASSADATVVIRYLWTRARVASFRMDLKAAIEDYRHAWDLAATEPKLAPDLRDQLEFSYADSLRLAGRMAEARSLAAQLLDRQSARIGPEHPLTCYTQLLLAGIEGYNPQQIEAALESATHAADCLDKTLGDSSIRTASAYQVLSDLKLQAGQYDDAAKGYQHLVSLFTAILGAETLQVINARMNEGVSLQLAGHLAQAELTLSSALDTAQTRLSWDAPTTESLRFHLADCRLDLRSTKDVDHLLADLTVETLNTSEIETDWPGRLAYEAGRLALFKGQVEVATPILQRAAQTLTSEGPDGRIFRASLQRLMAEIAQR
jgi:serine/threonine protein kinase